MMMIIPLLAVVILILANVTITIEITQPSEDKEKQCWDSIYWGDNSTVGLPENITGYCENR